MQKRFEWLEYVNRKDEKEKMEEMHQRKVEQMIMSAEGGAGLLHKITKPTMWRGGVQILKEEEEDARLSDRCEAKKKEWAMHWQCDESVQNVEDKPWKNEELKKSEEALPRLPSESPFGLDERNERRNCRFLGESGKVERSGTWPHQACTTVFFLIPKNVTSERPTPKLIVGEKASEHQKWRSGSRSIALIGMLPTGEMEELSVQCGKY